MRKALDTNYREKLLAYNKNLDARLLENYKITSKFTTVLSWGNNTTAYYVKSTAGEVVARVTANTPATRETCTKDVMLSQLLSGHLPTSDFLPNKHATYLTEFEDTLGKKCILRVSKFVPGLNPFEMNYDIYMQSLTLLHKLHQLTVALELPNVGVPNNDTRLLHGDLTPSNILVSYGKVCAILDFERACKGPVEYDFAFTMVFSWLRMPTTPFNEIFDKTLKLCDIQKAENKDLLYYYAKKHLQEFTDNIKASKNSYTKLARWQEDLRFAQQQLTKLTELAL